MENARRLVDSSYDVVSCLVGCCKTMHAYINRKMIFYMRQETLFRCLRKKEQNKRGGKISSNGKRATYLTPPVPQGTDLELSAHLRRTETLSSFPFDDDRVDLFQEVLTGSR